VQLLVECRESVGLQAGAQAKVRELDVALLVDQQIVGLDITVCN